MTGLEGTYDLNLEFTPEDYRVLLIRSAVYAGVTLPPEALMFLQGASDESIFKGLQTVGLKLEQRKAPLEVLLIDSMTKTPSRQLIQNPEGDDVRTRSHRHILLAVELVSHRRRLPCLIRLETP